MGFIIKNNFGPNIEVNEGGVVHFQQSKDGLWHTADAETVEYDDAVIVGEKNSTDNESRQNASTDMNSSHNDNNKTLSAKRQTILDQLCALADKGDWVSGITSDDVKARLKIVLGQGETPLSGKEVEQSETLWHLLENGRGDRVVIVWQNMVGYLDDNKLLIHKGSPALNKDFFEDDKGYTNIDKGRPSRGLMSADFESIIPLLDTYVSIK